MHPDNIYYTYPEDVKFSIRQLVVSTPHSFVTMVCMYEDSGRDFAYLNIMLHHIRMGGRFIPKQQLMVAISPPEHALLRFYPWYSRWYIHTVNWLHHKWLWLVQGK